MPCRGMDRVIPFTMKLVWFEVDSFNFLIRDLPTGGVFPPIQTAGHLESFGGGRASDQIYDGLVIPQRLAAPIRGDEREQPVFNFVPFASARRKVTDRNRKPGLIRGLLQFPFPTPQPRASAAA